MYSITFQRYNSDNEPVILHKVEPGQSLLEVAMDNSIAIAHDCGGMCSCGTCHILLGKGNEFVEFKSKRELHQLAKVKEASENSRLACQCVLLPGRGNLIVYFCISSI
jgi:ferredoxin, 2Fe-2S